MTVGAARVHDEGGKVTLTVVALEPTETGMIVSPATGSVYVIPASSAASLHELVAAVMSSR